MFPGLIVQSANNVDELANVLGTQVDLVVRPAKIKTVPFSDVADGVLSRVPTMKFARRLNVEWKYRDIRTKPGLRRREVLRLVTALKSQVNYEDPRACQSRPCQRR